MATYDFLFNGLGLRGWCDQDAAPGPMSMADLLARGAGAQPEKPWLQALWDVPFPSLDALNQACPAIARSRDLTRGLEQSFLNIKDPMKVVLDPITQPLSWALESALHIFTATPWWVMLPLMLALVWVASRSWALLGFVGSALAFLLFVDHYDYRHANDVDHLSYARFCAFIFGVPIGIAMSRSDTMQRMTRYRCWTCCRHCRPSSTSSR
jgi:glycine betaine/proline transport system permease protein